MFEPSEKTWKFYKWVQENRNPNFELRMDQVFFLNIFFSFNIGSGRTTLLNYLKDYDQ